MKKKKTRMALYGYSYAFAAAIGSTAFYSGTFLLKNIRKNDDYLNYTASGFVNAGWIATGIGGYKRGIVGAILGGILGTGYRLLGDYTFEASKNAWIQNRRYMIHHSKPRILVNSPNYYPKKSTETGH